MLIKLPCFSKIQDRAISIQDKVIAPPFVTTSTRVDPAAEIVKGCIVIDLSRYTQHT
jgi:hypothetical protein